MATAISLTLFNVAKYLFILIQFKMQPLGLVTVKILLLGVAAYILTLLLPTMGIPLFDIIIRSALLTIVFGGAMIFLKISPEVSGFYYATLERVRKMLK